MEAEAEAIQIFWVEAEAEAITKISYKEFSQKLNSEQSITLFYNKNT